MQLKTQNYLSCVVLFDIFWKIEVVSVVDLDKGVWFVLKTLLRSCNFFPRKLGCDGFTQNHHIQSDGFFSQFHVIYLFFNLLYFYLFCFAQQKSGGGGMASMGPRRRIPCMCVFHFLIIKLTVNLKTSEKLFNVQVVVRCI